MTTATEVLYSVEQQIATITLNRPAQRNALSIAAGEQLFDLWTEVDADPKVRVVILTATECGTFCAGMDLKEAAEIKRTRGCDILDVLKDPFYERMRSVKKPIIAAISVVNSVNPPDTSAVWAPFARMVWISARPPGVSVMRSEITRATISSSSPARSATRSRKAGSNSISPLILMIILDLF